MLIAIEGIDGAGKTTVSRYLFEELRRRGYDVVLLKEPTESEYGRKVRELLRSGKSNPHLELELFLKDREWNVRNNVLPALESGKIVIMDRYYYSTVAYQGASGIDIEYIRRLNERFPKPDLVIILDVRPEVALKRIEDRRRERFERLDFLRRVREIFLSIKNNVVVVDAERDLETVKSDVLNVVLKYLKDRNRLQSCPVG